MFGKVYLSLWQAQYPEVKLTHCKFERERERDRDKDKERIAKEVGKLENQQKLHNIFKQHNSVLMNLYGNMTLDRHLYSLDS